MKKFIIACVLAGILLTGCTEAISVKNIVATQQPAGSTAAVETDSATFELSDGSQIKLTINAVSETEERIAGESTLHDYVVRIDYGYENISSDSAIKIDSSNFKVYDELGQQAEFYNLTTENKAESINKGSTLESANVYYALNNESNFITIEFRYNTSAKAADATFTIKLQ